MIRNVIAGVLLIAAGAIFFLYTQPTYDQMQSTRTQNSEFDQALTKAKELQTRKDTLLRQFNSFNNDDLDRLKKMLPDQVDNIRLILDIDSMAQNRHMALQNVAISTSQHSPAGAIGAISAGNQKYNSLTLSFSTSGSYKQFKDFLSDLQSSLRIVDLVTLSISSANDTNGNAGEPQFNYNITIRTYWLR